LAQRIRQKVLDTDAEAEDFQNLISSSWGRCLPVGLRGVWRRLLMNCEQTDNATNRQTE